MPNQRLNVILSRSGVASRRHADAMIASGRVSVDGKIVRILGTKVDPSLHEIAVDGIPIEKPKKDHVYFVLYKPRNIVTTMSDPEGRPTIADYIPPGRRAFPVGRLDYDAEGLILLTSDGDLAHKLMHPKFGAERTYMVKVKGRPSPEKIAKLRRGLKLEDGFCKPLEVKFEKNVKENTWYRMKVAEGRNRLIKRLWLRMDHPVVKLVRIEYAGLKLGELPIGKVRPLRPAEIQKLQSLTR
jgi:23S rRNA pseudouridine2605 synthase